MESATTTYGLGSSMLKLPGRLHELLQRCSHMLPKGADGEVPLIKHDLEEIIALLQKSGEEHAAAVVKCWTKEVRELSYDIEDFLDQSEYAAAGLLQGGIIARRRIPRHKIIRWRRNKTPCIPEKLKQRLWMANKIREFSERVQEVLERHMMYNLHATSTASSRSRGASSGAWHPTPVVDDVHNHVGINLAINELAGWLTTMHGTRVHRLKVVSILGFGGVGKTNLAKELYRRLGQLFECRAFVQVSQMPDMRRVFISILSQVRPHQCPDNWKVHNLISSIRTHLQDKRYLIIVDDLWATSTWEIIKSALPDGKSHSRILTTTEIEDLAVHCCGYESKYVFNLKPLGEDDSRTLFFSSLFGSQRECPLELREVSQDITRKCCGLPLAIVTIASILTDYLVTQKQWDYVNKSLGCSLMKFPTLERTKQVLNLCYDNLPQYLKACMLYMSIYESGNIIQKDDLVNQWIAEGFICAIERQDRQEISRGYFDELVRRKLIQPADTNDSGEILSCVVHPIVLNLMMEKSLEENFVTAIHHSQATTILADKVRRLSLHFGNAEDVMPPTNMRLSQVRTFAFFGVFKCMPSIAEFRLLQVLILHLWGDNGTIRLDIRRISELFRLRYLKVASNVKIQLHTQMQGLQSLETLQIDARVTTVLSDITHLPGALHYRAPVERSLPNWIGHMTSLRILGCIDLSTHSMENLQELSRLTNLQDIRLTFCPSVLDTSSKNKMQDHLFLIIGKLGNLRSLTLVSKAFPRASFLDSAGSKNFSISNDGFIGVRVPALLQRFEFSAGICIFSCLPNFIGQLRNLCFLKIGINKITTDDIDVLRRLPSLAVLSLYVHTKLAERIVIGKDGFSVLKYFKFKSCHPWLKFEMGAMSNLQKLKLGFNARIGDQPSMMPVGMEHLSGLREVSAKIGGATISEVSHLTAELAFRDAIRVHARCPRMTVHCVNEIIGSMDDESSIKREEEKPCEVLDEEDSVEHDETVEISSKYRNKDVDNRYTFSDWDILRILINKLENQDDDVVHNIPVFDIYTVEPWDYRPVIVAEELQHLCFCPQQKREASGSKLTRATESGYWQATGSPEVIYSADGLPVGVKRRMEFYHGRAPSSQITQWRMVEFCAFQEAAQGTTDAGLQLRSEMRLCQLYVETTRMPTYIAPPELLQMKGDGASKQLTRTDEDSTKEDKMIQIVPWENADKHAPVRKRKGREPTKQLVTSSPQVDNTKAAMSSSQSSCLTTAAVPTRPRTRSLLASAIWKTSNPGADGYSWTNYAKKPIKGRKHPRDYYRCASGKTQSCDARKRVQRTDDDPLLYNVTYFGEHTCGEHPTHSNDQGPGAASASEAAEEQFLLPSTPPRFHSSDDDMVSCSLTNFLPGTKRSSVHE